MARLLFLDGMLRCKWCGRGFERPSKKGTFCSLRCKGDYQRSDKAKPVTKEWLRKKYIDEGLTANKIAEIVGRDPKSIWTWLKSFGIPTRPRGSYYDANSVFTFWLSEGGVHPCKGRKHTEEYKRRASERCKAEGRIPYDPQVGPPFKGKRGAEIPSWKGGVTTERQLFHSLPEWKAVVRLVWGRDKGVCQRCGRERIKGEKFAFDVHHIVSFAYKPLRTKLSNLVLLCEPCHHWVHSNENADRQFIQEIPCLS